MEGAHHCYETEMTSNILLAANVRVYQLLHRRPLFPSSLSFCCFSAEEPFRQVSNASLFFLAYNVETEKIAVVKQSLCHTENSSCLQWVISGAFYKLTAFSSRGLRTAGF